MLGLIMCKHHALDHKEWHLGYSDAHTIYIYAQVICCLSLPVAWAMEVK